LSGCPKTLGALKMKIEKEMAKATQPTKSLCFIEMKSNNKIKFALY
jgi:hypothetical protein